MAIATPDTHVNLLTGEVLDFKGMSDEEIVAALKDLQETFDRVKRAVRVAEAELTERMAKDGATLRPTELANLKLHNESRLVSKKAVEALHSRCPEQFKDRCFTFDIRPLKSGLNELAKLGDQWRDAVDRLYETKQKLKVEWKEGASS